MIALRVPLLAIAAGLLLSSPVFAQTANCEPWRLADAYEGIDEEYAKLKAGGNAEATWQYEQQTTLEELQSCQGSIGRRATYYWVIAQLIRGNLNEARSAMPVLQALSNAREFNDERKQYTALDDLLKAREADRDAENERKQEAEQQRKEEEQARQDARDAGIAIEEDTAPETPRRLRKAIKQFGAKEWALSSLSFNKVLEDPDAEYFHSDIRYYLANCLEQMGLPYSALEEYNRFLAGADPGSKFLAKGIKRSVSLARRMDAGWLLAPGLSKLDTSAVSAGFQGPAMYWVGMFHYDNQDWAAARGYLSMVPKNTEYYARARMVEGIVLTREQKPVDAIAPLAAAVNSARRDSGGGNTWEVANINLARAYYAIGNFERAIEHFERTPRGSELWFESMYEAAWSYFRLQRLSGALSHLQSVDSPFFDGVYHPDATLLRVLIFYYLCKYIDGQKMLAKFTERHYPIAEQLETAIREAEKDPNRLFKALYAWKTERKDAGIPLPEAVRQHFASDSNLVHVGNYIAGIDRELQAVAALKTGWERSALRRDLEGALDKRRRSATEDKGREAMAKLRGMHAVLQGHLGSSEIYKVELITAEKDLYDAAYRGQLLDKIANRKMDPNVPQGYRYWPFQGEYWLDELGWYEVNTTNECLEIRK